MCGRSERDSPSEPAVARTEPAVETLPTVVERREPAVAGAGEAPPEACALCRFFGVAHWCAQKTSGAITSPTTKAKTNHAALGERVSCARARSRVCAVPLRLTFARAPADNAPPQDALLDPAGRAPARAPAAPRKDPEETGNPIVAFHRPSFFGPDSSDRA
jgi:hypothetical protein